MSTSPLHLEVASLSDRGLIRAVNEDKALSIVPQDAQVMQQQGALFVVADGLGGHHFGDVASDLAVSVVREHYYQDQSNDTLTALRHAVEQAHQVICQRNGELANEQREFAMGTTCVAAVLKDDQVFIANAGDSLAYIVRGNEVKQIAQNHSWEQEQVRQGAMTLEEAKAQGKGNIITRCLGQKAALEVYAAGESVQDGDILILCTDGLHTLVSEAEICTIVQQHGAQESAARLIARANEDGGPDNVTVVVAHVSLGARSAV